MLYFGSVGSQLLRGFTTILYCDGVGRNVLSSVGKKGDFLSLV